jgi:transposase
MAENTQIAQITPQQQKAEAAYRRSLVGKMYLSHVAQDEIARRLKVDQSTISRDIKALKKQWMQDGAKDIAEFISQEIAELNEMEQQAAIEFGAKGGKNPRWLLARLAIKDRKYMLYGLDKKVVELQGSVDVVNIDDVRQQRWDQVQKSLAEALFVDAVFLDDHSTGD